MVPEEILAQAKRRIQVADHFLTQTYPMVQDPKLLVNILEGVMRAIEDVVDAMLAYEHAAGHVPAYHEGNFAAKVALLRGDVAKKYGFGHIDLSMISEMQEILHEHKESTAEFSRRGQYVIANHDFVLQTISVEKIKTYLMRAKALYQKAHDTINKI